MKRALGKIGFFFMVSFLWISLNSTEISAEIKKSGTCGDNLTWTLTEDDVLTISGTGDMWDYYVYQFSSSANIPWGDQVKECIVDYGVTSLGSKAFWNCKQLKKISLPESLEEIRSLAFYKCSSLLDISIPRSVTKIDDSVFEYCGLKSIYIPSNVVDFGRAFYYCEHLEEVIIEDGINSIGDNTFYWCRSLHSISIPNSVNSIGNSAFYVCDGLTNIDLPDSITTIGANAFGQAHGLTEFRIPSEIKVVEENFIYLSRKLKTVIIPKTVTQIKKSAFQGCPLADVFYEGTEEEWNKITIEENNDPLFSASIHFNYSGYQRAGGMEYVEEVYPYNTLLYDPHPDYKIAFTDSIALTGTGNAYLYKAGSDEPIETIPLNDESLNPEDPEAMPKVMIAGIDKKICYFLFESKIEPAQGYSITVDEGAIKFVDYDDSQNTYSDTGICFEGIKHGDWKFRFSPDYPGFSNQSITIEKSFYDTLFPPILSDYIQAIDNGEKGTCFGWVYTTAARYMNLMGINHIRNDNDLKNVPFGELIQYIKVAHISQFLSDKYAQQIINSRYTTNGVLFLQDLINRIKNFSEGTGDPIILGLIGIGRGHAVMPLDVQEIEEGYLIQVLDPNGPAVRNLILLTTGPVFLGAVFQDEEEGYKIITFTTIDDDIDSIAAFEQQWNPYTEKKLVITTTEINTDGYDPVYSLADSSIGNNGKFYYWTDENDINLVLEAGGNASVTDGYRNIEVGSESSSTVNINMSSIVSVDMIPQTDILSECSINYTRANDYDDYEYTNVQLSTDGNIAFRKEGELVTLENEDLEGTVISYNHGISNDEKEITITEDNYAFKIKNDEIIELRLTASGNCGEDLKWKLFSDGTLSITGTGDMFDFEEAPWSNYIEEIENLVIGEEVTSIGANAFAQCGNIADIEISGNVAIIGDYAFYDCANIESLILPESITSIGNNAFSGCTGLEKIHFMGDAPFVVVEGEEISYFTGVISKAYYPAGNSTWTLEVMKDYGGTITWKAYGPNMPVYGEPDFKLPASITAIEESAFEGSNMSVVFIPDSCKKIADYAFKDCNLLTQIRIPETCTVSDYAFDGCEEMYIFGTAGSDAESYCQSHEGFTFVEE